MNRNCLSWLAVAVLCTLVTPFVVTAQPEAKPGAKPADADRHAPLPNYFGKIAVSDEQRAQLYQVQDDYAAKIDALQRQVKMMIQERDGKMEELLTPGQKLRLQELREEARKKGAKTDDPREVPASVPPKSP